MPEIAHSRLFQGEAVGERAPLNRLRSTAGLQQIRLEVASAELAAVTASPFKTLLVAPA
jgi:hypothetical protein